MRKIIIGSRGSDLALWQARYTQAELKKLGHDAEITIIKTQGDKIQHLSFDKLEGKGFFTKEIEERLLDGSIDVAVHSHKDLPTENPKGLTVAAVSYREDPADILLISQEAYEQGALLNLAPGAKVGTSSFRRKSQIKAFRPDLMIDDLRGNVPTRIQKLRDGQYDAIVLALAGVKRLELDLGEFYTLRLDPRDMVPAQAQGVLAFQVREEDKEIQDIFSQLNNAEVATAIGVERTILNQLDGGCLLPLGVFCHQEDDKLNLSCSYSKQWEDFPLRANLLGTDPEKLSAEALKILTQKPAPKRVFITAEPSRHQLLKAACKAYGWELNAESFIDTKPLEVKEIPESDWVFFTSPTSASLFPNLEILEHRKVAALGEGTAEVLIDLGVEVNYTGLGQSSEEIAGEFSLFADGHSVLFPHSSISLKKVQQYVSDAVTVINLETYTTEQKTDVSQRDEDVLIFTSPSNARAYFEKNTLQENQEVVAIGPTTGKTLEEFEIKHTVARKTTDIALIDALTTYTV